MEHELITELKGTEYHHYCIRCRTRKVTTKPNWKSECGGKPLLGDIIAKWLARLGLHSRPGCNCEKRKSWINRKAAWLRRLFNASV